MNIYFITGASGVGKSTLLDKLEQKYKSKPWAFHHFDSIGVPSVDEMNKQYGSPSAWQEAKTYEWINQLTKEDGYEKIFLEGQVNLQFIHNGFQNIGFTNYKIILIDCTKEQMTHRLMHEREQLDLATENMNNWLKFLKEQARELNTPIIDSNKLSVEQTLMEFEKIIESH